MSVMRPSSDNCTGFGLFPEVLHYNPHYYDLLTRLAWNPAAIEQSAYLDDMVLRRYGADGYKPMRAAFQGLVDTVYGPGGSEEAPYQHRLYPGDVCSGRPSSASTSSPVFLRRPGASARRAEQTLGGKRLGRRFPPVRQRKCSSSTCRCWKRPPRPRTSTRLAIRTGARRT